MGGYGCTTLIRSASQFKIEILNYNKCKIDPQLLGLCILAIGIWAWSEKDIINNLSKLTTIALDPAFILICSGTITFIIGFAGCVGALRENTCLLAAVSIKYSNIILFSNIVYRLYQYSIFLAVLLLFQMCAGMLAFVLKDKGWIKEQATDGLRSFITHYREDPDQQNLIDWIQEDWLQCCGIEGPKDWDSNNYFNCSSLAVGSREACGVPFSCCKRRPHERHDKQCGYDVRKAGFVSNLNIA